MSRRAGVGKVHVFVASGMKNWADVPICTCGALETSRVHTMPEVSDESRELSARMIGERGSSEAINSGDLHIAGSN